MTVDDAQMWAWCAMDTLIFAIVLNQHVEVESTSPGSGPQDPAIWGTFCQHSFFFPSRADAVTWQRRPE
jgi:alkylmercury lyase